MEQQNEGGDIVSELVKIKGVDTTLTLTCAGMLKWHDGQRLRCLTVEKEVLGFSTVGSQVFVKTVVETPGLCCVGGGDKGLTRKTFVFEPLSEGSLQLWSRKLGQYIDSLGNFFTYGICLIYLFFCMWSGLNFFFFFLKQGGLNYC